jgi:hypothetical protein
MFNSKKQAMSQFPGSQARTGFGVAGGRLYSPGGTRLGQESGSPTRLELQFSVKENDERANIQGLSRSPQTCNAFDYSLQSRELRFACHNASGAAGQDAPSEGAPG